MEAQKLGALTNKQAKYLRPRSKSSKHTLLNSRAMGSGHSKSRTPHEDETQAIRRQIGKRSSVNFLQKLESRPLPPRPVSFAAKVRDPEPELLMGNTPRPLSSYPLSFPALSPSSTATVVRASEPTATSFGHQLAEDPSTEAEHHHHSRHGSSVASVSPELTSQSSFNETLQNIEHLRDGREKSDKVDIKTPQLSDGSTADEFEELQEPDTVSEGFMDEYDESEPGTPVAMPRTLLTPVLRMPTPLAHDSPTRYGFDEAMENARVAVSREIQKKRAATGPELFRQALELQISTGYVNQPPQQAAVRSSVEKRFATDAAPCRVYRPPRSKYPPSEVFRRALSRQHPLPPPRGMEPSARTTRLLRRAWPGNLFRDDLTPTQRNRCALALPLSSTQKNCPGNHGKWYETSNLLHPVECAICLCASDCPSDTAVSWMCEYCAIRICAECRAVLDASGMPRLMSRFEDGSKTVEAKKAKMNRRSAM
ncbi:hypothetical protein ANO11243_038740 [Dothideomycetidae sp. 11243]|nr:hypothetical protein ANO11243_038740 [fungal sp. No.11243]